jgi:DNA gyrase subunit B
VLTRIMVPLEEALQTLERRGVNLRTYLARHTERGVPSFHVIAGGHEEWVYTPEEVDAIRERERQRLGRDLVVEDADTPVAGDGQPTAPADTFIEQEFHEAKKINKGLKELAPYGLLPGDLVPQVRVAGREPPVRLRLESGDAGKVLTTLRELVSELRRLGEKGLSVTRFKGLGEMNASELWDTTLDPEKRTVMQVRLEDAMKADELFRTLMGDRVEPRKEFIYKHAIEAKDIDLHGA